MKDSKINPSMKLPDGIDPVGERDIWEKDYRLLIQKWMASGEIDHLPEGDERRQFPRFKLKSKSITILVEAQFPVVDLSLSGISFYSNLAVDARQSINLVLEKTFEVAVEIIRCQKTNVDFDGVQWPYRVHCNFVNHKHGMQLLVLLNEMDNLSIDVDPSN